MFGWAFHLLWHTKGMNIVFNKKIRGSKSQNEQEQHYHILVKLSAVIIEML